MIIENLLRTPVAITQETDLDCQNYRRQIFILIYNQREIIILILKYYS